MILVADSGSTKTDWMAYTPKKNLKFETQGLNPYFVNANDIVKIISKNKELASYANQVTEIYFFGSGCSNPDKHEIISNGLSSFFPKAFISVDHNLIGNAYATCGNKKGLCCILGTGSNIAYYDGREVFAGVHGLGYILGDEGSKTYFGKRMITSFLYKTMPVDLMDSFYKMFKIDKEIVINQIYTQPFANTYLASFSMFMKDRQCHPFIQKILHEGFQEFIDTNIKNYKNYNSLTCNFAGSIAFHYQKALKEIMAKNDLKLGVIIKKPIEGIFNYILNKEKAING